MSTNAKLQLILFFLDQCGSERPGGHARILYFKTGEVVLQRLPLRNFEQREPNAEKVILQLKTVLGRSVVLKVLVQRSSSSHPMGSDILVSDGREYLKPTMKGDSIDLLSRPGRNIMLWLRIFL